VVHMVFSRLIVVAVSLWFNVTSHCRTQGKVENVAHSKSWSFIPIFYCLLDYLIESPNPHHQDFCASPVHQLHENVFGTDELEASGIVEAEMERDGWQLRSCLSTGYSSVSGHEWRL